MDAEFARLALRFLETGEEALLSRIAATPGAAHIAAHAALSSGDGNAPGAPELVERLLTAEPMTRVDLQGIRERLKRMEEDGDSRQRAWREAAAYLPPGALTEATLFLTVGYDIGVTAGGNASLNLAHPHFAENPAELWFYCVHELHHAGFQGYCPMPNLSDVRTTHDLAGLIRYLTTLEGMAVHAARRWRAEAGAMRADPDYVALFDVVRLDAYEEAYFKLLRGLTAEGPRPVQGSDWDILERMSAGDRLWYRVGACMAQRLEDALGREGLVETAVAGAAVFFERYRTEFVRASE
jgi:hypothetical protein